jgi:hypothetical protein
VSYEDVRTFQAVRDVMAAAERRRVSDAEVCRQAVSGLVATLDEGACEQITKSR